MTPSARGTASPQRRLDPPAVLAVTELAAPVAVAPPIAVATSEPLVRFRVSAKPAASVNPRPIGNVDLTIIWLGAAFAVPWFGLQILDGYVTRRRTASVLVQHFANGFIAEFERPLVRYDDTERPLIPRPQRATRAVRHSSRAGPGTAEPEPHGPQEECRIRRWPSVVRTRPPCLRQWCPLHAGGMGRGAFRPRTGPKQPGVTCISSF